MTVWLEPMFPFGHLRGVLPALQSFGIDLTPDAPVTVASILGMFVALSCIGFGVTYFGAKQLEIVADTVTESFGKSWFVGVLAQPLIIPAFALSLLAVAITVIGILVLPLVAIGGVLVILAAAVGGYLAVARSLGGAYLARRQVAGHQVTITQFRSLVTGLAGMLAIWLPAALLGWIPLIGQLLAGLAFLFTWVLVTAGFGAIVLSRAGLRASLERKPQVEALTDEFYWPVTTGEFSIKEMRSVARDRT